MSTKFSAVPEGFHTAAPYLMVNDAEQAISFYKQAFGAEELTQTLDSTGKIRNAEIKIGDSPVMIGAHDNVDVNPKVQIPLQSLPPVSIYLYVENVDAMIAQAEVAGARVLYPATDQFYGNREGGIIDPFGIVWWIATRIEALSVTDMEHRANEAKSVPNG